jgi:hypothetical protein
MKQSNPSERDTKVTPQLDETAFQDFRTHKKRTARRSDRNARSNHNCVHRI